MGSRIVILQQGDEGRWLKVLAPDGYRAWVRSWSICPASPSWPRKGLFVSAPSAVIRHRPNLGSSAARTVGIGCRLEARRARRRGWIGVSTPDRKAGWICSSAVDPDDLPAAGRFWDPPHDRFGQLTVEPFRRASLPRLLRRARSLLGISYRWGGVSGAGLDCSGLVRLVFGLEGIGLPRDAGDQASALHRWRIDLDPRELRRGDLVFFGASGDRIDHVALGIGGRSGRFLHASGQVRISSLSVSDPRFEGALAGKVQAIVRPPW